MKLNRKILFSLLMVSLMAFNVPLTVIESSSAQSSTESIYQPVQTTYPVDGWNHHPNYSSFNGINTDLIRTSSSGGSFDADWAARSNGTSARTISNIACDVNQTIIDETGLSDYNWIWGQFITHDIDFTLTQNGRTALAENIDIPIPAGDEWLDPFSVGSLQIPMHRSLYNTSTGNESTPREFPNSITGWLDGSMIYGSSFSDSSWLREWRHGKMKTTYTEQGEFLPLASEGDNSTPSVSFVGFSSSERYVAGDPRANEHAALTAMHVIFLREHNRIAEEIVSYDNTLTDSEVYQIARKINTAQVQSITYNEYIPSLGIVLPAYSGFNNSTDPRISNEFATLAFRMGHSQITEQTLRLDNQFDEHWAGHRNLSDGFWNPSEMIATGGVGPVLRGAAWATQAANDIYTVHDMRISMFGEPGFGGLDMCAIDIQRGRDHGLPDYNSIRESLGLSRISNWSEITDDEDVIARMNQAYSDIDQADPIMGMYAEQHITGSPLGDSMYTLIAEQYLRLRDGDPLYFENDLELQPYLGTISNSSLAQIILRNSEINLLQCNIMYSEKEVNNMNCYNNDFSDYSPLDDNNLEIVDYSPKLNINLIDKTSQSGFDQINFPDILHWSAYGPSIAIGDCNNDGYDDVWIGNSYDQEGLESSNSSPSDSIYLMKNNGAGQFEDITKASGLYLQNTTLLGASWADYDNDGNLDLYVSDAGDHTNLNLTFRNTLFRNQGDCNFIDVTLEVGLGNLGHSSTSSWADYDHDGDLDLFSHNSGPIMASDTSLRPETDILYKNNLSESGIATFEDYTFEAGGVYGTIYNPGEDDDQIGVGIKLSYASTSAANPSSQVSVLPSVKNLKSFDNYGTGVSWAGLFIDLDDDNWEDILIGTDFGISPLFKNSGNGSFTMYTDEANLAIPGTAMGLDAADVDGDGDLDICQSNYGPNYLYKQTSRMSFTESSVTSGLNRGVSSKSVNWDCNFVDIDLDGDLDLWFGSGSISAYTTFSYNSIYLNNGEGFFTEVVFSSEMLHPIAKTMGSAWADFDLDGDLDLIISESNFGVKYFENDAVQNSDANWIALDIKADLDQSGVYVTAVNAKVDIKFSGGKTVRQVVKIGSGFSGSKDSTIHLGVPSNEIIESIEIKWNDGSTKIIEEPQLNQYLTIKNVMNYGQMPIDTSNDDNLDSKNSISNLLGSTILIILFSFVIISIFNSRKSN